MRLRTLCRTTLLLCFVHVFIGNAQTQAGRSTIKNIVGTVKIRRGAGPKWLPARPRMKLKQSDAIRTFVESMVELELLDGSQITLNENSTVELADLTQRKEGAQSTKIRIMTGNVMSNIKKLTNTKSKFEFETPTATASIRGTKVGFEVDGQKTDVRVYEGKVYVVPKGGRSGAEVGANQMTSVVSGQKTVKIVKLTEPEPASGEQTDTTAVADTTAPDSADADTAAADTAASDTASAESETVDTETDTSFADEDTVETTEDTTAQADTSRAEDDEDSADKTAMRLTLNSPSQGSIFRPGSQVVVAGKVFPAKATVVVEGKPATVNPGGGFRLSVPASAAAGDYEISVEVSFRGQS
ncbi:MAG: hypothetical protein GF350_00665, partial [Chitinivibrionales bacterium]|nr:hypothetical protein [Chitinivibrionales bacterium]